MDYPRSASHIFSLFKRFGRFRTKPNTQDCVRCPNQPVWASSDIGWFLLGFPAPLAEPVIAHRPAGFRPFGPVADALGLTRRYQRSICVAAALPVPRRGRKAQYVNDVHGLRFDGSPSNNAYDIKNRAALSIPLREHCIFLPLARLGVLLTMPPCIVRLVEVSQLDYGSSR